MSIRQGAGNKVGLIGTAPRTRIDFISLKPLFLVLLLFSLLFRASYSEASGTIIVRVTLNHEEKGEYFVELADDDFLIREADLRGMGFTVVKGETMEIGGQTYVSLRSMSGVEYVFDENNLAVKINADPSLLARRTVDFGYKRRENLFYPKDNSAFFNYGISYSDGRSSDSGAWNVANELGIRAHDLLFLTDSLYTRTSEDENFVRLFSTLTSDSREKMRRVVMGDFLASTGALGSAVSLGGVKVSREYSIDPYFIKNPLLNFSGFTTLPAEAEVYVNGNRVLTDRFSPGEFELRNISTYKGGGLVEVVLRDPFGREERLTYPFYFATELLGKGLDEYSYNIGFLREDFGVESNNYGDLAVSAFHRFGLNDAVTIGYRAEGTGDVYGLGSDARFLLGHRGIVSLALSGSRDSRDGKDGNWGGAGILGYEYVGRNLSGRLSVTGFTEDYATLNEPTAERTSFVAGGGIGYNYRGLGSFSFNFNISDKYQGAGRDIYVVSYTRPLTNRTRFLSRFSTVKEGDDSDYLVFFGVTHNFERDANMSVDFEVSEDENSQSVQVWNSTPLGKGASYRASLERNEEGDKTVYGVNPAVQYRSGHGIYRGEYLLLSSETGESDYRYTLSASGGIGYVGGTIGLSRPIRDSFGLVDVGGLKGVDVFVNNQEVGKTGPSGKAFVPELSSYVDNQVSIDDQDIPLDYTIEEITVHVSPPLRSGSVIAFDVNRFQAVTGFLKMEEDGELKPVEYNDVKIADKGEERMFPTGRDGELYIENIKPGRYKASFVYENRECLFELVVPESEETLIDLGEVVCRGNTYQSSRDANEAPPKETVPQERPREVIIPVAAPEGSFLNDMADIPVVEKGFAYKEFSDYIAFEGTVHFPFSSDRINGNEDEVLRRVFRLLDYNRVLEAEVEGYTDQSGSEDYNLRLGMRRALAVKSRLIELGLPERKISRVESYGESRPVCESQDETCRRRNQRAYVRLILDSRVMNFGVE